MSPVLAIWPSALSLGLTLGVGLACGPGLVVRAIHGETPARITVGCGERQSAECAALRIPKYAIDLVGSATVRWVRVSQDGTLLVASWTTGNEDAVRILVSGIDLVRKKEIWRVSLADDISQAPVDALVLPSVVVLPIAESAGSFRVVTLDRQSGRELWRRSQTSRSIHGGYGGQAAMEIDSVHALAADLSDNFLVTAETSHIRVLDANNGSVTSTRVLSEPDDRSFPRIRLVHDAIYVIDRGLSRVPRDFSAGGWYQPFPTYARHSTPDAFVLGVAAGAAAGLAVPGMPSFLGGMFDADTSYDFGRISDPIEADGRVCIGAFAVVSCFDRSTGELSWSRKFPVGQFEKLTVVPGIMCALSGGSFVRVEKETPTRVASTARTLFCVRTSDGAPLPGFSSFLTENTPGTPFARSPELPYGTTEVEQFEGPETAGVGLPWIADIAAIDRGLLVAVGRKVLRLALPAGTIADQTDLSDLGAPRRLTQVGGVIVASLGRGFAGFEAGTGRLLWKRRLRLPMSTQNPPAEQNSPSLSPPPFWSLSRSGTIVATQSDGQFVGIAVANGSTAWVLQNADHAVVVGPNRSWFVAVRGTQIDVYEPPTPARAATAVNREEADAGLAPREEIRITYRAPPGCPSKDAFEGLVLGPEVRPAPSASDERAERFRVEIAASGATFKGTLEIAAVGGPAARRELTGAQCDDVATGLALMVSIAIDPPPMASEAPPDSLPRSTGDLAYGVVEGQP